MEKKQKAYEMFKKALETDVNYKPAFDEKFFFEDEMNQLKTTKIYEDYPES